MKPKMFEELLESVREGGAILRGQRKASRRLEVGSSGIRAIRERTSLSQSEFARLIGVSVKTLQNWEQDRRRPTGAGSDAVEDHRVRAPVGGEGRDSIRRKSGLRIGSAAYPYRSMRNSMPVNEENVVAVMGDSAPQAPRDLSRVFFQSGIVLVIASLSTG